MPAPINPSMSNYLGGDAPAFDPSSMARTGAFLPDTPASMSPSAPVGPPTPNALGQLGLTPSDIGGAPQTQAPRAPVPAQTPAPTPKLFFHQPADGTGAPAKANSSFMMPGSSAGPQLVKAHELAKADPTRLKALDDSMGIDQVIANRIQQDAAKNVGDAAAGVADAKALGYGGIADVLGVQSKDTKSAADVALDERRQFINGLQKLQEDKAKIQVDPNDYQKKRGVGGTMLDAIAAGLAGMGQGFLHEGGPNPVLEDINRRIADNIDAQKENYNRQNQRVGDAINTYKMAFEATGSHDEAMKAARGYELQAAQTTAEKLAAASGDPVAKANANQVVAGLQNEQVKNEQERIKTGIGEHQWVQAQIANGGVTDADIRKRARDIEDDARKRGIDLTEEQARAHAIKDLVDRRVSGGDENLATQPKPGSAPAVAPRAPGSTAYSPMRNIQGTAAHANLQQQEEFNAEAAGLIKRKLGVRGAQFEGAQKAYFVEPGDTADTIAHKQRALAHLASLPDATGKGASEEAEGAP